MQNFSIELSKRLSELSGHTTGEGYDADGSSLLNMRHYYVDSKDHGIMMVCGHRIKWGEDNDELKVICPAWQVEDLLRNLPTIRKLKYGPPIRMAFLPDLEAYIKPLGELVNAIRTREEIYDRVTYHQMVISSFLIKDPDTAYQKIEEYLWSILT